MVKYGKYSIRQTNQWTFCKDQCKNTCDVVTKNQNGERFHANYICIYDRKTVGNFLI
jgi:hypothetical protein